MVALTEAGTSGVTASGGSAGEIISSNNESSDPQSGSSRSSELNSRPSKRASTMGVNVGRPSSSPSEALGDSMVVSDKLEALSNHES